ncbi:MAG: L-aspartate oxidase [bacterium]
MNPKNIQYSFDFLVIGSGIAGLNFALLAANDGSVAVVTKKELMESNSNYAQGGIAAVLDKHDSFEQHIQDTLKAGCFLNDKNAVEIMIKEAPSAIQRLIDLGAGFNRDERNLSLTQEGGHSQARVAHAKDATGKEIERALIYNVRNHPNISTFESHIAFDLAVEHNKCYGAYVFDSTKKNICFFRANNTIIATGGLCQVYSRNCNPKIATGDGVAMAHRAKAVIKDMEFIQFHPTALNLKNKPAFLISETLRGEGAVLKNRKGERFIEKYDSQAELAPRDIVSRAVFNEMRSGPVYLDIRHRGISFIKNRFPYIYEKLWWYGIKMEKHLIPVAPAAHYACGGIHTDTEGQTSVSCLLAVGEASHTGVHGGNRLASNSLLECVVFSSRAASNIVKSKKPMKDFNKGELFNANIVDIGTKRDRRVDKLKKQIAEIMWSDIGIERDQNKMQIARKQLEKIEGKAQEIYQNKLSAQTIELRNLAQVALLITNAAISRKKSACAHFLKPVSK